VIFFLLQAGSFLTNFFRLAWLKDWNNIPRLLFYPLQDNEQNAFSIPNTDAMTFPAAGTDLVFFGAEQPAFVCCFDCCLDSGV
jgi:hypothetical protein